MGGAALASSVRDWWRDGTGSWNAFWFTPRDPTTLGLMRIATGAMLFYAHLVLAIDLTAFLGEAAWIDNETARSLHDGSYGDPDWGRSYLWHIDRPLGIWIHHGFTMLVTLAFAAGLLTRVTAPLAWFLQLMLIHRLTGALFGLDQIATYVAMYLMLTPCGSRFSIDAWLRRRFRRRLDDRAARFLRWMLPPPTPSVAANVGTRLLQIHLCVIYLFGGLAKARGQMWWDGTAVWFAVGNFEYQSIDMTWMSRYPLLFSTLSHVTLFWEIFYCALVWPKWTRPLVLAIAVAVHGGIAMFLGMITFGVMMIVANMIFVDPVWLRNLISTDTNPTGDDPKAQPADDPVAASSSSQRA